MAKVKNTTITLRPEEKELLVKARAVIESRTGKPIRLGKAVAMMSRKVINKMYGR